MKYCLQCKEHKLKRIVKDYRQGLLKHEIDKKKKKE